MPNVGVARVVVVVSGGSEDDVSRSKRTASMDGESSFSSSWWSNITLDSILVAMRRADNRLVGFLSMLWLPPL